MQLNQFLILRNTIQVIIFVLKFQSQYCRFLARHTNGDIWACSTVLSIRYTLALAVKICPVNISPGLNLPKFVESCPRNSAEKNSPVESCPAPPPPKLTFLLKISIIFFKKHLKSMINALNE